MYRPFIPSPRKGFVPNGHIFRPNFGPRSPYHGFQTHFQNVNSISENPTKEFWCETCDREFRTSQLLESHIQQHEKCNIDGCQFVAHSKVITKHIQMQHSSGLYNKIANLNNPEAINKWREERKKKYPTKSNIERKSAEIKEKIDRGEKMCLQKNKDQRFREHLMEKKGVKRKHEKRHQNEQNKMQTFKSNPKRSQPPKITKTAVTLANSKQLKPFSGIQNIFSNSDSEEGELESECNFQIDDDDDGTNDTLQNNETSYKPALCGALSNLICNYGSSDDENDVSQKVNPTAISKDKKPEMPKANPNPTISKNCENDISEDSGPEEIKNETGQQNIGNDVYVKGALIKSKKLIPHLRQGKHGTIKKWKPKPPSTLLQKLLFSEMRQERNIVLQCIRHIIKTNYFDQE